MRNGLRRLSALMFVITLIVTAASADSFSFSKDVSTASSIAPADLFDLETASKLKTIPACKAEVNDHNIILTFLTELPENVAFTVNSTDGSPVITGLSDQRLTIAEPSTQNWLLLRWTDGDIGISVQYLIYADGRFEFWTASADDGTRQITRKGRDNPYEMRITLENVSNTSIYYDTDGKLLSSILLGDVRESGIMPLTIQYDEYGRPVDITAADTQHTYFYNRAEGCWEDDTGSFVNDSILLSFHGERHPAPSAKTLDIGQIYLFETSANIDRNALLNNIPSLEGLLLEDGTVTFLSNADSAEVLVNGNAYFSTDQNTILHNGTGFCIEALDIYPESQAQITLHRNNITAVYRNNIPEYVFDTVSGVTLNSDGTLTYIVGAVEAVYNKKGNLTEAKIQSSDGATLTYNRQGRLVGWEMDGYIWTRETGWCTTAVNEKGNIIHPSCKQPAAVNLSDYPAITLKE